MLVGAANFLPMPWVRKVDAADYMLIGVPSSLSTPYGVADDQDHLNGTIMAIEAINAKGGVQGRELRTFVPDYDKLSAESTQASIAACIDKKVHAYSNAFTFEFCITASIDMKITGVNKIRNGSGILVLFFS